MARQAYGEPRTFRPETQPLLDAILQEVEKFEGMGLAVTGRQLYYRIRDRLPGIVAACRAARASTSTYAWETPGDALYDKVCVLVMQGRDYGLIDWTSIIDDGRDPELPHFWGSGADVLRAAWSGFRLDRWENQEHYVEVWTEKDSHVALMRQAVAGLYVPIQMCKGYGSSTALHDAAERFIERDNQQGVIIYAGDHDASGMDIDRDIEDRLAFYDAYEVDVQRVALTFDQARQAKLSPERLKKRTRKDGRVVYADTRGQGYFDRFKTDETWELDALDPAELQRLVRSAVESYIDPNAWAETEEREKAEREKLRKTADEWKAAA